MCLWAIICVQVISTEGLRADDPASRDAAELKLRNLPVELARDVRQAWLDERDPEVKARLREVWRELYRKHSDQLWYEGRAESALKKLLEGEGVKDIDAEYALRVKEAKEVVETYMPPPEDARFIRKYDPKTAQQFLREYHGRWCIPYLVEILRSSQDSGREQRAFQVLKEWASESFPILRTGLHKPSESANGDFRTMEILALERRQLELVRDDENLGPKVRSLAEDFIKSRWASTVPK